MRLPVVHAGPVEAAELVEIQLGHLCNNRCVFCSSGQATAMGQASPMELAPVLAALERAKRQRARKVTFLGGEPTLQRAFLPALRRAVGLGFEEIEIFTNGVKAARRSFVDEVAAMGRFSWRFSVQGGNRDAHDEAVEKTGAFDRICRAMDNVRAHGHRITANACINERSYRSLPDYVTLVKRYGIEQLHIDVVRPSSAGQRNDDYLREIMPPHEEMAPYFARMLAAFEAWDPSFDVNVGNYPFCLLPEWAHRIHHGGMNTLTLASDLENDLSENDKYTAQHRDKIYGASCGQCVFMRECTGVFEAYARIHGTASLKPQSLKMWADSDPSGRRGFIAAVVRDLCEVCPQGHPAQPRVHESGVMFESAGVTVQVHPRGTTRLPVARTQHVELSISCATQRSRIQVEEWVDVVRTVGTMELAPRATWIAALMGSEHVAEGRRAIVSLVAGLDRITQQRPDSNWPGVIVVDSSGKSSRISISWPGASELIEQRELPSDRT